MDWEKQDNELRQLMDGADFLPDEEQRNSVDVWRKLQEKMKPAKKGVTGYWMQLAAAACVVGMLGFGLWWIHKNNTSVETDGVVNNEEIEHKPGTNEPAIEQRKEQQISTTLTPDKESIHNGFTTETQLSNKNLKPARENMLPESLVNIEKESSLPNKSDDVNMAFIETEKENDNNSVNAVVTATSAQDSKPDIASVAPEKKPKIRVVHYNELNGMHATAPPVFVLTKNSETEWESVAVQNSITKKSHPYSLKIDITPAPKKSL